MFAAMTFEPGVLNLVDQRILPAEEKWIRYESIEPIADAITTMVVRGAPAIGCTAAFGLAIDVHNFATEHPDKTVADYAGRFDGVCQLMAKTRPTAVNLFFAIDEMQKLFQETPSDASMEELQERFYQHAVKLFEEDVQTCKTMGDHGADDMIAGKVKLRVLTHCNTGSLATAGYGTALGVIRSLHARGQLEMVYVDETRPWLQGARLTAFELAKDGIPYRLIADSTAAYLMQQGEIDVAVTGADRIAANGDTANKIGTYSVAVNCHYHGIPFYVAAPLTTFDFSLASGADIPVEEREARELTHSGDRQIAPADAVCYNPSFDVTPAKLIAGIISEKGVAKAPFLENLAKLRH